MNEKNKKYKQEHSKVTLELQETNTKHLEMQQNIERTISETEMKSKTEIKELNESKQKQETELKALKDHIQLLTNQNEENRKTSGQFQNDFARRDEELTKLRKQIEENKENKQAREKLEVQLKGLNKELEQQTSDYDKLNHELQGVREELEGKKNEFEVIPKDKGNMQDKYFKMEKEKHDLQEQIKELHTLINTLKQNTRELKFKLDEVEKEKDKNKTEKNKFEKQLTDERIQKEEERDSIEKLENELKGEKENLVFHKELIRKLNEDIANRPTSQTIIKLREELGQANEFKSTFEDKLKQKSKEIANKDAKLHQLRKQIENIQVDTHSPESVNSNADRNVFPVPSEKAKGQAKVGVTNISSDKLQRVEVANPIIKLREEGGANDRFRLINDKKTSSQPSFPNRHQFAQQTENCTNSQTVRTPPVPSIKTHLKRSNTFPHLNEGQDNQEQHHSYGYQSPKNIPPKPTIPFTRSYSQLIPNPNFTHSHHSQDTQPRKYQSLRRAYPTPGVQEETGQGGYSGGNRRRSLFEKPSVTEEPTTHISYPMPPVEPDTSPLTLTKVTTPVTPSGDKAKVMIIWEKEIPTLERDITYLDNIEGAISLKLNETKAVFQGNATFSLGEHTGNILFPSSGEMHSVQCFEVRKREMQMGIIRLKFVGSEKTESKQPQP